MPEPSYLQEVIAAYMPDELVAALRSGETERYEPGCYPEFMPVWCDGCQKWEMVAYLTEYEAREGQLFIEWHKGDLDGNWDIVDEAEWGTDEARQQEVEYGVDAYVAAWNEYAEWVVAHGGEDPLENYIVARTFTRSVTCRVTLVRAIGGPRMTQVRKRGVIIPREQWPDALLNFFEPDYIRIPTGARFPNLTWGELLDADELSDKHFTRLGMTMTANVRMENSIPRKPEAIRRDVLAIAKRDVRGQSKKGGAPA